MEVAGGVAGGVRGTWLACSQPGPAGSRVAPLRGDVHREGPEIEVGSRICGTGLFSRVDDHPSSRSPSSASRLLLLSISRAVSRSCPTRATALPTPFGSLLTISLRILEASRHELALVVIAICSGLAAGFALAVKAGAA